MKINEIILEATAAKPLRKGEREAHPHAMQFQGIDQYYGMYRFGIAMAGAPNMDTPKEGPAKDVPTIWMYTDAEEEIVVKAAKNQGIKGTTIVPKGRSKELDVVNKHSPTAKPKKNKYGV